MGVSTTKQVRERLQLPAETPDEEVGRLRASMLASADTFDLGNHQYLEIIAETLPGMTNLVFFRRPWMLITWERKTLATSDTPVILGPSVTAAEDGTGTSLGMPARSSCRSVDVRRCCSAICPRRAPAGRRIASPATPSSRTRSTSTRCGTPDARPSTIPT